MTTMRVGTGVAAAMVALVLVRGAVTAQTPFSAEAVDAAARALPQLRSLIVSRRGQVMVERYYGGARADRPANVKSASKSVISALVGIAIDRGLVKGVGEPIATYFPELRAASDRAKQAITVEDLLTMRSGLEGTSGRHYGAWVTSANWVQHALSRPMTAAPGASMDYSTGNTHLLSAILAKATGRTTWSFANDVLGGPLGFRLPPWPRDPQGIYFGGNDMLMTPRQLLAFAELYLNGGRARGKQVLPEAWVRKSCEGRPRELPEWARGVGPGGRVDPLRDRQYGYLWWVHDLAGHDTCFAWGYGGQYAFVLPDLQLVIVATSSPDVSEERRDHRRQLIDIVARLVVEPLAALRDQADR